MQRLLPPLLGIVLVTAPALVSPAEASDPWSAWRFLVGEWAGEGGSQPGQGAGSFSFTFDLQNRVLVRRNHVDYPATTEHPAFGHDDLMVIYFEPGSNVARAVYFDSEGHIIHYTAEFSSDGKQLTFLSDLQPGVPRFRLTYTRREADGLTVKFEIAPPGRPDHFALYLQGTARKKKPN